MFSPLTHEWSGAEEVAAVALPAAWWALSLQPAAWGAAAIRQLAPLLTAAQPGVRRLAGRLVGGLAGWGPQAAYTAGAVLRPLVYAPTRTVRGESLVLLAAVVARDPAALGSPDWRWRTTALDLTAGDPALTAPVTALLATCPPRRRPAPAREAELWAEVARPLRRAA